jgi:hypothetical protein
MPEQNAGALDRWLSTIKQLLQLLLLAIVIVLIVTNWYSVNIFANRFLHSATQVSIADVLTVSITSSGGYPREEKWAAFYRVAGKVKVLEASLDDKTTGFEYLDLTAITPLNLGGSYIGDANEMMFLGERDIQLQADETLRIYTFADEKRMNEEKSPEMARKQGRRVVVAKPIKNKKEKKEKKEEAEEKGIFQTHVGDGDRIVLIDREKRVILDLDYWWVKPPAP